MSLFFVFKPNLGNTNDQPKTFFNNIIVRDFVYRTIDCRRCKHVHIRCILANKTPTNFQTPFLRA